MTIILINNYILINHLLSDKSLSSVSLKSVFGVLGVFVCLFLF